MAKTTKKPERTSKNINLKQAKGSKLNDLVNQYMALKKQVAELTGQMDTIKEEIDKISGTYKYDDLILEGYKVSYIVKDGTRFNTTVFKEDKPNIYKKYLVPTHSEYREIKALSNKDITVKAS